MEIFQNVTIRPNHHYALHIPNQIRQWGPLHAVAEFAGEKLIGVLQKIQRNTRLGKCFFVSPPAGQGLILLCIVQMDGTMMPRFSQWQRLLGDHPIIEDIVNPVTAKKNMDPHQSRMRIKLEDGDYEALLTNIQNGKENVRDYR